MSFIDRLKGREPLFPGPPARPGHPASKPRPLHAGYLGRISDSLQLMQDQGSAQTLCDLVAAAARASRGEALVAYLQSTAVADLPLALVIQSARLHAATLAHRRWDDLVKRYKDEAVAALLPLPPHLIEQTRAFASCSYLQLPGAGGPPPPKQLLAQDSLISKVSEIRRTAGLAQLVVVEVGMDATGALTCSSLMAELLDLTPGRIVAHVRPTLHPGDEALDSMLADAVELL